MNTGSKEQRKSSGNSPASILLFHKPKAVTVSGASQDGQKTVYDILPEWVKADGWVPVGRLDRDSRGLLLFVRDRSLVDKLSKPGAYLKTYDVWIRGRVNDAHLQSIRSGIPTPVGVLTCHEIEALGSTGPKQHLRVVLSEGKNRHIRRMFGALKDAVHGTPLKVVELQRTQFGDIHLDIPSGHWRMLRETEIQSLKISHRDAESQR